MAATSIEIWVWSGVLLQDLDAVPPVHLIDMVPQSVSGAGQPYALCEGARALASGLREDYLIYLREVLVLAHWESVPVDIWLCYVY